MKGVGIMKKTSLLLICLILCSVYASCTAATEISYYESSDISYTDVFAENSFSVSSEVGKENSIEDDEESKAIGIFDPAEQSASQENLVEESLSSILDSLNANHIFVYDIGADKFILEKDADVNIIPASVTKLLTALYALEVAPVDLVITPSDELYLIDPYSSVAGIKQEHSFTLEQLIAAMILPSGNDASYIVAAATVRYQANAPDMSGREAVDSFMTALNDYAKDIGCTGTVFTVPDGLAGNEHYTTARDLVIIAKHALANPVIAKYMSMPEYTFISVSGHEFSWRNTNAHLNTASPYHSACVTGMKTGTLDLYSVMVSAEINGNTYIIGVFGAPSHDSRYMDSLKIINTLAETGSLGNSAQ